MASSLEELLAEEGFKGRRSLTSSRSSFKSEAIIMRLYPSRDHRNRDFPSGNRIKTERTSSDVSRYTLGGELPRSDSSARSRLRDGIVRSENADVDSKKENREKLEQNDFDDVLRRKRSSVNPLEGFKGTEIVEVGSEQDSRGKDILSDDIQRSRRREKYSKDIGQKERYEERSGKDDKLEKRLDSSSSKHIFGSSSFNGRNRRSMKQSEYAKAKSSRGSLKSKSFNNNLNQKHSVQAASEPAIREVAVEAIISILSGYIKRFFKDKDFRINLHQNCISSLVFHGVNDHNTESKVLVNLEEAIKVVKRAAEESASTKEVKKASLQLSVITGLNSNDLKEGFTSRIPNSNLSASAHLYLSVIYKLQKKDRTSAKHLLQVFCDSPFQARTILLPELWDYLFFPHLSHLKAWYDQEAASLANKGRLSKLKLLQKMYNESLDSGTYQFAVYYKDWLTEGVEDPSIPSIQLPSASVKALHQGGSHSNSSELATPSGPFSPQAMVSKRLYDSVFCWASKPGVDEADYDVEGHKFDHCMRSSGGSSVEVKDMLTYSCEAVKHMDQDLHEGSSKSLHNDEFLLEDGDLLTVEKSWKSLASRVSHGKDIDDNVRSCYTSQKSASDACLLHAPSHVKENELTLKRLAKSVFEVQQTESSLDITFSNEPTKMRPSFEELHGSYECFNERSFSNIPQYFVCPLTGKLFEDPVTLETGQTFERAAIRDWLYLGNTTCPVTGKTLDHLAVPLTNFVLKRVIDNWKSENCRHLLAFASHMVGNYLAHGNEKAIFMLEQLLTISGWERVAKVKHVLSLGGLQFLIKRFEIGAPEEKLRVLPLLSCCIEADADCRDQIIRSIDTRCLFEILQSKQVKAKTNVVMVLIEIVCLSRRKDVSLLLSGLDNEEIVNTMQVLLLYLQSSLPAQRPLAAVLLLHFHLLAEPQKCSIYREEAVDAITVALNASLTDEEVREKCCRALLILGGRCSSSGKLLTENWILEQAGSTRKCEMNPLHNKDNIVVNATITLDDEEQQSNEKWLRDVSASLLGSGKKSFTKAISNCLGSGNLDLVLVCLTTVVWLSHALSSICDAELQLSAFSTLISRLKETLENGQQVEHKVLASISLLNFSRTPECRVLLMETGEEIEVPLRRLADITWTAKELYALIIGEDF